MTLRSTVWPFTLDHVESWAHLGNVFTPDECAAIIAIGNAGVSTDAKVSVYADATVNLQQVTKPSVRDSKVSWLFPDSDTGWIFNRVAHAVLSLNSQFFKFDLYGLVEGLQFTRYDAPSGFYGPHTDSYLGIHPRKLSVTIQLSPDEDYEGGELMLHYGTPAVKAPTEQGKAIVFPSYTLHEVKPVTKGTRYSLVGWVTGPTFK